MVANVVGIADTVVLVVAIIVGAAMALSQVIERRGRLWRDLAEERQAMLTDQDARLHRQQLEIDALRMRPDMSAVQEQLTEAMRQSSERWATQARALEAHEANAQKRAEGMSAVLQAIAHRLEVGTDG